MGEEREILIETILQLPVASKHREKMCTHCAKTMTFAVVKHKNTQLFYCDEHFIKLYGDDRYKSLKSFSIANPHKLIFCELKMQVEVRDSNVD